MAGKVVVSTLNNDTGVLATQNGMTGIAKAWVNFNGTGTVAIRDSFNVSSITDNGTGDYTINFTTAMPNTNYSPVVTSGGWGSSYNYSGTYVGAGATPTTTTLRIAVRTGATFDDQPAVCVAVFSS
jgi:hypothetical protein